MATTSKEHVFMGDLHYEHNLWRNELRFYKEELTILENRLREILAKNTADEAEANAESYQNRFEIQRDRISDLKHRIKGHEHHLTEYAENHPIAVDHVHFIDHSAMREEMDRFRELYAELKESFNRFAVKWM